MRVFISYSGKDLELVEYLADALQDIAEVDYWDGSKELGEPDWEQIFEWIDEADLVLVLITDRTVRRGMAVGQEVGHARAKQKIIIPLVSSRVRSDDLGCLRGVAYQSFDEGNFEEAVDFVVDAVDQRRLDQNATTWLAVGILGGLAYLAMKKNNRPPSGGLPPWSGPL